MIFDGDGQLVGRVLEHADGLPSEVEWDPRYDLDLIEDLRAPPGRRGLVVVRRPRRVAPPRSLRPRPGRALRRLTASGRPLPRRPDFLFSRPFAEI